MWSYNSYIKVFRSFNKLKTWNSDDIDVLTFNAIEQHCLLLCIALSYCDSRCSDLKFLYPRVSDSKCSCGHGNFWLPKKIIWLSATHQLKSPTIVPDVSISWFVWEKVSDKMKILQISIKAFLMSLYLKYFLSAGRLSRNTCKL